MRKNKTRNQNLDVEKAKSSLNKIYQIFQDISFNADEINKSRCPYKNAKSRCTAKFDCKNQYFTNDEELAVCTGSDKLDYRSAWEI
ncbi:MAG: hypothetical protein CL748_01420 [Chloroflexi bacterium]|nr:hypothetical protein [Chloroflexota bacterium]|tara:strand:- start:226 stop:483 length:258 start_codon:yes stop_codon:yes gene_type:complete